MFSLKRATVTVEIEKDAYLTAHKIIRRWSRSQAAYGDAISRYPAVVIPRTAYHHGSSGWTTARAGSDIGVFADAALYAIKMAWEEDSPSSTMAPRSRPNSREPQPADDRLS